MNSKPICSVENCGKVSNARGLCEAHYMRWKRHGDPNVKKNLRGEMPATCTEPDCDRKTYARNVCHFHYRRLMHSGGVELKYRTKPKRADLSYTGVHTRLRSEYGPASKYECLCGEQARDWACLAPPVAGVLKQYSLRLDEYLPLCRPCHTALDMFRRNVVEQTGPSRVRLLPPGVHAVKEMGA